jgi:hypothetical protein
MEKRWGKSLSWCRDLIGKEIPGPLLPGRWGERRVGTGSSFTFVKMSSRVKEIHISD